MTLQTIDLRQDFPGLPQVQSPTSLLAYVRNQETFLGEDHRFPAMIICPGGGYSYCSPREAEPVALRFLSAGYQSFVLTYPVAPDRYPSALLYLSAAVAWVRRNADALHVDPQRVCVCGFSAAGHLCTSLCSLWQEEFIAQQLGLAPEENRPSAAVLCYPVVTSGEFAHRNSIKNLLGDQPDPALLEKVSLEKTAGPLFPPTFLWTTYTDQSVPAENSLMLAARLRQCGVNVEFHMFHRGPHGLSLCDTTTAAAPAHIDPHSAHWFELCLEWLDRTLEQ